MQRSWKFRLSKSLLLTLVLPQGVIAEEPLWPHVLPMPEGIQSKIKAGEEGGILVWTPPGADHIRAVLLVTINGDNKEFSEYAGLRAIAARQRLGITPCPSVPKPPPQNPRPSRRDIRGCSSRNPTFPRSGGGRQRPRAKSSWRNCTNSSRSRSRSSNRKRRIAAWPASGQRAMRSEESVEYWSSCVH